MREKIPLFDIVAGKSIGAINAAVLVSNVVNRHKTWEEAGGVLEDFWMKGLRLLLTSANGVNDGKKTSYV